MLTMKNDMPCFELIALNCEACVSGFLGGSFFIDNIFANYNFTLTGPVTRGSLHYVPLWARRCNLYLSRLLLLLSTDILFSSLKVNEKLNFPRIILH